VLALAAGHGLRDQDHGASRRLEIGNVLHRHDSRFREQPAETGGMDSPGTRGVDAKPAHIFEPVKQREQIGRRRRFGVVPQPRESNDVSTTAPSGAKAALSRSSSVRSLSSWFS
jgi:hypothetical protein